MNTSETNYTVGEPKPEIFTPQFVAGLIERVESLEKKIAAMNPREVLATEPEAAPAAEAAPRKKFDLFFDHRKVVFAEYRRRSKTATVIFCNQGTFHEVFFDLDLPEDLTFYEVVNPRPKERS